MIQNVFLRLLPFCFMLFTLSGFAQENWKKEVDEKGTIVYTKNTEGSKIKAFRTTRTMKGNVHQCVALFMDWQNHPQWMYKIKSCSMVEETNPLDRYLYYVVGMDWPFKDRDLISRTQYVYNPADGSVSIILKSFPNKKGPVGDNVRMMIAEGYYKFTPKPNGMVEAFYEYKSDPEGLPAWLINMFVTDAPKTTMVTIEKKINEPAYKNAKIAWIK